MQTFFSFFMKVYWVCKTVVYMYYIMWNLQFKFFSYSVELGRFQNSSVPVLSLIRFPVPVFLGSTKSESSGSGFGQFGYTVLTVLIFSQKSAQILAKLRILQAKISKSCFLYTFGLSLRPFEFEKGGTYLCRTHLDSNF